MLRFGHACAVIAVLAACGHPPQPIEPKAAAARPTPSVLVSATPSAPPTMPPLAKRRDAIGAANFVMYWVKVSNYAAATGDTRRLRAISAPDCEGCNRYIELYEKTYAAGGYFRGSTWTLEDVSVAAENGNYQVFAHVTSPTSMYQVDSSSSAQSARGEDSSLVFEAVRRPPTWRLAQLVSEAAWVD